MKKEEKKIEEKEKTKDYSIEPKSQKRLKGISKFFYILATFLKVCLIIGIVGIGIAMIAVPVLTTNVKTEKKENANVLKLFDNDIYYKRSEKEFVMFKLDDNGEETEKTEFTKPSDVDALNEVFDYLEENDLTKVTIIAEVLLVLTVVVLVIEIKILKKVHKFFKNIHDESTPFIKDNVELLKGMGKLSIIELCIGVVMSLICTYTINTTFSLRITNITEILLFFVFAYIFEYGYKLQNDTKGKIYS